MRDRSRDRSVPRLNTAALPDLIFTVLFFFMIVTHMRDEEHHVQYTVPQGTEVEQLKRKSSVVFIYIGPPTKALQPKLGTATRIQLNGRLVTVDDIPRLIEEERRQMAPEDRERMTVSIKADKATDMGTVNDVKQALRRANALVVNYSSTEKEKE
jgi:biopolymer transport protein ExbD